MATPQQGLAVTTGAAGVPVNAIAANQSGGYITNPLEALDQGQAADDPSAVLYVNQVGPATLEANVTTLALQPGQSVDVIPASTAPISVASPIANHKFTSVSWV